MIYARVVLLAALTVGGSAVAFVACGSDDAPIDGGDGDGQSSVDGSSGGGRDAAVCKPEGQDCATSGECCSASCDVATKKCGKPVGTCKAPGVACTTGNECCTFSCVSGKCSDTLCVADNQACTANEECCGGVCSAGACTPLSGSCKTSGNPCTAGGECCSKFCNNGLCNGQPSFCTQTGDACSTDTECCGGICKKTTGPLGLCAVAAGSGGGNCTIAGTVCGGGGVTVFDGGVPQCGGECCSRACAPYGPTGVMVCQPESGCRATGEVCAKDTDCCGSAGLPDGSESKVTCSKAGGAALGKCDNGNKCSPAGSICRLATKSCNATDRCCAGTVQTNPLVCAQDALGVPRCKILPNFDCTTQPAPPPGTACASSADCCGKPCVPDPSGVGFVCGATCVPKAGACSTHADCCPGTPCVFPPGSSTGTCGGVVGSDGGVSHPPPGDGGGGGGGCALYGQDCNTAADCCSGVPCNGGKCVVLIK